MGPGPGTKVAAMLRDTQKIEPDACILLVGLAAVLALAVARGVGPRATAAWVFIGYVAPTRYPMSTPDRQLRCGGSASLPSRRQPYVSSPGGTVMR